MHTSSCSSFTCFTRYAELTQDGGAPLDDTHHYLKWQRDAQAAGRTTCPTGDAFGERMLSRSSHEEAQNSSKDSFRGQHPRAPK